MLTQDSNSPRVCDTPGQGFQCHTPISHSWGQYSPFFSVPSAINPDPPSLDLNGCELTFAQILSRHGARAPTLGKATLYAALVARIRESVPPGQYGSGYEFLANWEYNLGKEGLTPLGEQQMFNSGKKFYARYRSLARENIPFIRAAGMDRVVMSAVNWTRGFYEARRDDGLSEDDHPLPWPILEIPETKEENNTLHHGLCTAFEEGPYSTIGASAQKTYLSTFAPPITARLNANLPGANLSDADVILLMDLCPFHTVASPSWTLSPFCTLFTPAEWQHYDYYQTLGKWYGFGPGNPLGPTQGVGWVNELIARLTGQPVQDRTCVNHTLDSDPRTFPLKRKLYADFGHDNDMVSVLGALGLYEGVGALPNVTRKEAEEIGGFSAGWTVPFAGRVYIEKMRCRAGDWKKRRDGEGEEEEEEEEEEELVRLLVNDRVVPLRGCEADEMGRCRLSKFVESLKFAREGGKWDLCWT